jgi:hypothetical protein
MPSKHSFTPSANDWDIVADPPEATVDTSDERKTAKLRRSQEWKQVDEYVTGRVALYTQHLPGHNPAIQSTDRNWIVADCIIRELNDLRNFVETVSHGVSD